MANAKDQKVDIKVDLVDEAELTQEQIDEQNLQTALRYLEIAKYMKKYDDQDKYYHQAIKYTKKVVPNRPELIPLREELRKMKCQVRAEGIVSSFKEALEIKNSAKSPEDYSNAQRIFEEIHKYEEKHPLYEAYTTPDVFAEAAGCYRDCEKQIKSCDDLRNQMIAKNKRKTRLVNTVGVLIIIALVFFTRTDLFKKVAGDVCSMVHADGYASFFYKSAFEATGDEAMKDKYLDHCYKAGESALAGEDFETARKQFKAAAVYDYKDSREQLIIREKYNVANTEVGEIVNFADMNWIVLEHNGDNTVMIKDSSLSNIAFENGGGVTNWANSSIRKFLNEDFITENIYEEELSAMVLMDVVAENNPEFGTSAGENTQDYVALLSSAEVEKYKDILRETQTMWWLRTPGAHEDSVAFVTTDKTIMYYGTGSGTATFSAKPMITVNTK